MTHHRLLLLERWGLSEGLVWLKGLGMLVRALTATPATTPLGSRASLRSEGGSLSVEAQRRCMDWR